MIHNIDLVNVNEVRKGEKMEKESENFLRMISAKSAIEILEFLSDHSETQYKEMQEFVNTHTLNLRLSELLNYSLIQHYLQRSERIEWYEITEKGRKILHYLRELVALAQS